MKLKADSEKPKSKNNLINQIYMKTENVILMQQARESLNGKWGLAIGTYLMLVLISVVLQQFDQLGTLFILLITGPLSLGAAIFSLAISRDKEPKFEQLFQGFQKFEVAFLAYILMVIFILLWTLLLIIPGIIAAFSYSMTFYILADDKSIKAIAALDKSKKMMDGFKMKYFFLSLRFLAWALLCVLTLGIGFLWLIPYMQVTIAKFYADVKANFKEEESMHFEN
jgi:uncharacterized membrane protein